MWVMTVDIKQFLDSSRPVKGIADDIRAEFYKQLFKGEIPHLDDILEDLCDQDDVESFDYELDRLYDWADANKVWLGAR